MSLQIRINDQPITVEKGRTLLQAARENNIYIPTLCDYPGLPPHGSCRMCVVEIQGKNNTPTACTTPAEDGMVVQTNTPKIQALRGELLQMLLADHPSSCLFCPERSHCDECMVTLRKSALTTGCRSCPKDNQCELQTMVDQVGMPQQSYPGRYRMLKVKKSDPFFDRDYNLCILCGRCIRTCDELHFSNTLAYTKRGSALVVGTGHNRTHLEAGCSFCGACVEACPTGALTEKTRKWDEKAAHETVTTCPLCSIACQIRLQSSQQSVIGSLPVHLKGSMQDTLCVLGRFGITELVNHPTRLSQPAKSAGMHSLEISWDEAIQLAAEKLSQCPPERFSLRISSSSTNEDLYIAHKFTRQVMNSDGFQITGHEQALVSFPFLLKWLSQAKPLADIEQADTILTLGVDGRYAQSPVEVKIHQAKKRGAKLVSLHAQPHSLDRFADVWLHPDAGQETAWLRELVTAIKQPGSDNQRDTLCGRAAVLVQEARHLVVFVGPAFLGHPDAALLACVGDLLEQTGADLILLPEQGNLMGAMLIGGMHAQIARDQTDLDVLCLIGAQPPEDQPGDPFIVYQNMYPATSKWPVDLTLPGTAFSEMEGTCFDHTGGVREFHQAVPAPGTAAPAWINLCKIARQMGFKGFNYQNAAEIQVELTERLQKSQMSLLSNWAAQSTTFSKDTSTFTPLTNHHYQGFPLAQWVDGLKMLTADKANSDVKNY